MAMFVRRRGLQEHPCLVIAQRRRDAFPVHRARPLHPQYRVMQHRVPPGDDVDAGDVAELLRPMQPGECHEVLHVLPVGAAGIGVVEVGEPLELRGDRRQGVKLRVREVDRGRKLGDRN
jgi:hypothetical protein